MQFNLEGQKALVTGAAGGIGRPIALALARAGCDLALASRNLDKLREVAAEVEALNRRAHAIPLDLCDRSSIEFCGRRAIEKLGHIDILVNNAAAFAHSSVASTDPDVFENVIRVNLTGVMLMSREIVPHMTERGRGTIVMISSTAGLRSDINSSAYAASKHGMQALGESLLREVRKRGVRVVMICPSLVDTQPTENPDTLRQDGRGVHLRSEDVADAVVFSCALPGRALIRQIELWGTNP
jgi:3-oxoacyl-[acyl-carrier protein] reductase